MIKVDQEALWSAVNNWEEQAPVEILLNMNEYKKHFFNNYGIEISGWPMNECSVVDEQKYTVFLLRWS